MTTDANPTRRRVIASALGLLGAAAASGTAAGRLLGGSSRLDAATPRVPAIGGSATVEIPARRLGVPAPASASPAEAGPLERPPAGRVAFPIDPTADSYVLDNFGDCRGARAHVGVDIISERGAPVYAVEDGALTGQFTNTGTAGYGWSLRGVDGRRYRYFHLESFAPGLTLGAPVVFGQVIGYVGSTGNFITVGGEVVEDRNNVHLHLEILVDGTGPIDPLPLLEVPDGIGIGAPLKSCLARV